MVANGFARLSLDRATFAQLPILHYLRVALKMTESGTVSTCSKDSKVSVTTVTEKNRRSGFQSVCLLLNACAKMLIFDSSSYLQLTGREGCKTTKSFGESESSSEDVYGNVITSTTAGSFVRPELQRKMTLVVERRSEVTNFLDNELATFLGANTYDLKSESEQHLCILLNTYARFQVRNLAVVGNLLNAYCVIEKRLSESESRSQSHNSNVAVSQLSQGISNVFLAVGRLNLMQN